MKCVHLKPWTSTHCTSKPTKPKQYSNVKMLNQRKMIAQVSKDMHAMRFLWMTRGEGKKKKNPKENRN